MIMLHKTYVDIIKDMRAISDRIITIMNIGKTHIKLAPGDMVECPLSVASCDPLRTHAGPHECC
jgi:hypothetical protein